MAFLAQAAAARPKEDGSAFLGSWIGRVDGVEHRFTITGTTEKITPEYKVIGKATYQGKEVPFTSPLSHRIHNGALQFKASYGRPVDLILQQTEVTMTVVGDELRLSAVARNGKNVNATFKRVAGGAVPPATRPQNPGASTHTSAPPRATSGPFSVTAVARVPRNQAGDNVFVTNDGTVILATSDLATGTGAIAFWDPIAARATRTIPLSKAPLDMIQSADGSTLCVCTMADANKPGGRVLVLDAATGKERLALDTATIPSPALSGDGSRLALYIGDILGDKVSIQVFQVADGKRLLDLPCKVFRNSPQRTSLSADGKRVLAPGFPGQGSVALVDVATGKAVWTGKVTADESLRGLSPDGKWVVAGTVVQPKTVREMATQHLLIWDAAKADPTPRDVKASGAGKCRGVFLNQGRHFIVCDSSGKEPIINLSTGQVEFTLASPDNLHCDYAAESPDGSRLLTRAALHTYRLWTTPWASKKPADQ